MAIVTAALIVAACSDDGGEPTPQTGDQTPTPSPASTATAIPAASPTFTPGASDAELAGRIVFVSFRDGDQELYLMSADGSELTNLTNDPADDFDPDWSPNGEQIAFVSKRIREEVHIFVMDADGGNVRQITVEASGGLAPRWSNGGDKIVFSRGAGLVVADANGENQLVVLDAEAGDGEEPCRAGAFAGGWSPDDSKIVYYTANIVTQEGQLCTVTSDGSQEVEVLVSGPANYNVEPVWSPDGRYVAYRIIDDGVHDISILDIETGEITNVTSDEQIDVEPDWSPDGEWIVFASIRDGNNFDIYVMRRDGSDLLRLTSAGPKDAYPGWAP